MAAAKHRHPSGRFARPGFGGRDSVTGEYRAHDRDNSVLHSVDILQPQNSAPDWSDRGNSVHGGYWARSPYRFTHPDYRNDR